MTEAAQSAILQTSIFVLRLIGKLTLGPNDFLLLQLFEFHCEESARHHIACPVSSSYNTSMVAVP